MQHANLNASYFARRYKNYDIPNKQVKQEPVTKAIGVKEPDVQNQSKTPDAMAAALARISALEMAAKKPAAPEAPKAPKAPPAPPAAPKPKFGFNDDGLF